MRSHFVWLFLISLILIYVGNYTKLSVGELVWVRGDELNEFVSGFGLVIDKVITHMEHCYMVDVFILHNGMIYRPGNVSQLGVL